MREFPEIAGYAIRREIGRGAAGVVYEAVSDNGAWCAIKVFESMSSNPVLLARQIKRVMEGGAAEVTVPLVEVSLKSRPALVVMPVLAAGEGGEPRNLQREITFPVDWDFLRHLAWRLRVLHQARVAHGNLKPGNIFLDESGRPLLADYACGLMPGVHRFPYSDALLYAPPEQLRNPEGYLEEAGYRWDVYAFGVLAYRSFFGKFPRADDLFTPVNPSPGTVGNFEIEADHEGIACSLEASEPVRWPAEGVDEVGKRRREILASCLSLDPAGRPRDMTEVSRRLEAIEDEIAAERERKQLIEEREEDRRRKRVANRRLVLVAMVSVGLALGWGGERLHRENEAETAAAKFRNFREEAEQEVSGLEKGLVAVLEKEERALARAAAARRDLSEEREKTREELGSAVLVNDHLFDWVLEGGDGELPALAGREERLVFLLKEIDRQVSGMDNRPALARQASLLRLRGAEVALALGDLENGEKRLAEAVAAGHFPGPETARARLRLLLLASEEDRDSLPERLAGHEAKIREALADHESKLPGALAALALVKARSWEKQGEPAKALEHYLVSLEKFRSLAGSFPDNVALHFGIGTRALAAARAAGTTGVGAKEADLRAEAAEAFAVLAGKLEKASPEVDYQLVSARAGQALTEWQQGGLFEAEKMARENVEDLTELQKQMPGDFRITVDLVSQQGIIATALRDEGKIDEARALLTAGIASLETGLRENPDNGRARYLLASMKWQLSGILGQLGREETELSLGKEAREGLEFLLAGKVRQPHPAKTRKALAYLCGDLGHAAEKNGDREMARAHFQSSQRYWEDLAKDAPDDREIQEGLAWVRDRLARLRD